MKGDTSYCDWRKAVDERLNQIYCTTIADAGLDGDLINHWQTDETPSEFVEWFGNKYDLDPIASPIRFRRQGGQL
jgi:hypothetical protein